MKAFWLFGVLAVLLGCGSANQLYLSPNASVVNTPGTKDTLTDGKLLGVSVDGHNLNLLFDSGANISFLYDIDKIGGEGILNKNNHFTLHAVGASGNFKTRFYYTKSITSNTSQSQYYPLGFIPKYEVTNACDDFKYVGVFGLDAFYKSQYPVMLNYRDNSISILNNDSIPAGFTEVPADFSNGVIRLVGKVHDKEMLLLFDTGAGASVLMPAGTEPARKPDVEMMTTLETATGLHDACTKVYKAPVTVGSIVNEEVLVSHDEGVSDNLFGFELISKFNWIINFRQRKIYAERIAEFDTDTRLERFREITYRVAARDGKLVVATVRKGESGYKMGDIIASVNGQPVGSGNICSLMKQLNESEDWGSYTIVVQAR